MTKYLTGQSIEGIGENRQNENPLDCLKVYAKRFGFEEYRHHTDETDDRLERFVDYLEDLRSHSRYPNPNLWEKSDYAINLLLDLSSQNQAFELITENSKFVKDENLFEYFLSAFDYLEYTDGEPNFSMNSAYDFLSKISSTIS